MQTITLLNADVVDGLKTLDSGSIDLIVTSPPYNVGKEYEVGVSKDEYTKLINIVCNEFRRVLKPDGRFCINVPVTMNSDTETRFVMYEWENAINASGLKMRDTITWNQVNSGNDTSWGSWKSASSPWLRHQCEFIIVGYNKQWKKLNKGKSDISGKDFMAWCIDHWDMACSRCKWHPAVFPEELPKRCIQLFSYVGDTILDPFCGSATTLKVARDLGRDATGIEKEKKYCDKIRSSNAFNQRSLDDSIKYIYKVIDNTTEGTIICKQ